MRWRGRARRVAAEPEAADHLTVHIERDPAAKCDDASRNLTVPRPLRLKSGLNGFEF